MTRVSEPVVNLVGMTDLVMPRSGRVAGIVTTAELTAAGFSGTRIRTVTRRGGLHRVGRGVYANGPRAREILAIADGKRLLQLAAAVAVRGPGAVVSHESAAYLHSIDLLASPEAATLTCPPGRGWTASPGVRLHSARLPAEHITTRARLPVTTPARTVADLARTLSFRAAVVTADSALHRKLVTKPELTAVLLTCPRWRGARQAADVIDFADGRAESPLTQSRRVQAGSRPSRAVRIRFSDTGPGVPSTCANRLTLNSSISHRIACTSGRDRAPGGSCLQTASYSVVTRCTAAIRSASFACSPASLSSRRTMAFRYRMRSGNLELPLSEMNPG